MTNFFLNEANHENLFRQEITKQHETPLPFERMQVQVKYKL